MWDAMLYSLVDSCCFGGNVPPDPVDGGSTSSCIRVFYLNNIYVGNF